MKGTFIKAVAVVGVLFAAGLMIQTLAVASPMPAGVGQTIAAEVVVARNQVRKRDRKKDGSCLLPADQTRKRDRKKDRKKDGTCAS